MLKAPKKSKLRCIYSNHFRRKKKNKLVLRVLSLMLSNTTGALMVKEFKKNQEHRLSESDYRVNDVLSGGHDLQLKTGNK